MFAITDIAIMKNGTFAMNRTRIQMAKTTLIQKAHGLTTLSGGGIVPRRRQLYQTMFDERENERVHRRPIEPGFWGEGREESLNEVSGIEGHCMPILAHADPAQLMTL